MIVVKKDSKDMPSVHEIEVRNPVTYTYQLIGNIKSTQGKKMVSCFMNNKVLWSCCVEEMIRFTNKADEQWSRVITVRCNLFVIQDLLLSFESGWNSSKIWNSSSDMTIWLMCFYNACLMTVKVKSTVSHSAMLNS